MSTRLVLCCVVLLSGMLLPQVVLPQEDKIFALRLAIAEKEKSEQSLALRSDALAAQLAAEQKKARPDAGKITMLSNEILSITESRNKLKAAIISTANELMQVKAGLLAVYEQRVKQLQERSQLSADEAAELAALSVRRILLQPGISAFTINPERLLALAPAATASAREIELFRGYVSAAITEVAEASERTKAMLAESEQLRRLALKLKRYLAADPVSGPLAANVTSVTSGSVRTGDPLTGFTNEFSENISSFQEVISVLTPLVTGSGETATASSDIQGMSVKQYTRLLKIALSRLEGYRQLLEARLR